MFVLDNWPPCVPLLIIFSYNLKSNMDKVVGKLISKATMIQNLISFYLWNQKLCFKTESYSDQIWGKNNFKPLLLSTSVTPL
jgi:hypothetical protein